VVSGSSLLQLYKGKADLSRRAVVYDLPGLSLREYINIKAKLTLPKYELEDIVKNNVDIASMFTKKVNPLVMHKQYFAHGDYPFYLEEIKNFHQKLNNSINLSKETDLPQLMGVEVGNISKIKKLIYHIAIRVSFQPNSTKLAASLEMNIQTMNTYLHYLHEASILHLLWESGKAYSLVSKPEKIFLHNTNICHIVPASRTNIGNIRETFFVNQVSKKYSVNTAPKGDFFVDDTYTFEIGGQSKNATQVKGIKNSYLAIDESLIGYKNSIPLWLFGFLY
jgi:uncharacterized protein